MMPRAERAALKIPPRRFLDFRFAGDARPKPSVPPHYDIAHTTGECTIKADGRSKMPAMHGAPRAERRVKSTHLLARIG